MGKSLVTAGLATALAEMKHRVTLVDLDLGAANLHTVFGIKTTERGIGDYLFSPHSKKLDDYAVETGIPGLRLISSNGFIPGIANLTHQQKLKILKAITKLPSDYVLLDLGAGTSHNVVDFFSITESGIVVTMSEPTAVLNAYEFLKNVFFRMITHRFSKNDPVLELIRLHKTQADKAPTVDSLIQLLEAEHPESAGILRALCASFSPRLIINMSHDDSMSLGQNLQEICRQFLGIRLDFLGLVPWDDSVSESFIRMSPLLKSFPESSPAVALRAIARKCRGMEWTDGAGKAPASAALEEDVSDAPETAFGASLKNHTDKDLSFLLGQFMGEVSNQLLQEAQSMTPGLTPAMASDPGKILDYVSFEPRVADHATTPKFIPLEESEPARIRRSWWNRLLGRRFSGEDVRIIQGIPYAENIPLALQEAEALACDDAEASGKAWFQAGMKLIHQHQLSAAVRAFKQALSCLPGHWMLANNYAAALLASGLVQPAQELLQKGLRSAPNNAALHFNSALAHWKTRHYAEASAVFRRLADKREMIPDSGMLQAYCLYRLMDYGQAARLYEGLVEQNVKDLESRFNHGLCLLRERRYEEAISAFTALLFFAPDDAEASAARGLAHLCLENPVEAFNDLNAAVQKQPAQLALRGLRGMIAYLAGRYDKAIEELDIIVQLVPNHPQYRKLQKEIHQRLLVP